MVSEKNSNFSERLKNVRLGLRLTQDKIGERLDVTGNYVYLLESGQKQPSLKVVDKLEELEKELDRRTSPLVLTEEVVGYGAQRAFEIKFTTTEPKAAECITHLSDYLNQVGADRDRLSWLLIELRDRYKVSPAQTEKPAPAKIHGVSSSVAEKIRALGPGAVAKARAAARERELKSPTDEHTGDK